MLNIRTLLVDPFGKPVPYKRRQVVAMRVSAFPNPTEVKYLAQNALDNPRERLEVARYFFLWTEDSDETFLLCIICGDRREIRVLNDSSLTSNVQKYYPQRVLNVMHVVATSYNTAYPDFCTIPKHLIEQEVKFNLIAAVLREVYCHKNVSLRFDKTKEYLKFPIVSNDEPSKKMWVFIKWKAWCLKFCTVCTKGFGTIAFEVGNYLKFQVIWSHKF